MKCSSVCLLCAEPSSSIHLLILRMEMPDRYLYQLFHHVNEMLGQNLNCQKIYIAFLPFIQVVGVSEVYWCFNCQD